MPDLPTGSLLLHRVDHHQWRAFAPVATTLVVPLDELASHADELRLVVRADDEVVVRYLWTRACGAPERPTGRAIALRPPSWCRVLHNGRSAWEHTWAYQSSVLNIGFGDLAADTFRTTSPIVTDDVRAWLR